MTRRAWTLLTLAALFYFLANQTQVGWLYLISNGLLGLLLVAWLYGLRALRPLRGSRGLAKGGAGEGDPLDPPAFHEEDPLTVTLELHNPAARALFALQGTERCPVAPPREEEQPFFVPHLFRGERATLRYATRCDRRGPHRFPAVEIRSAGPFGLFRARRRLEIPTELLVLPFYHPLRRLPALESRAAPQRQSPRVGSGGEVIGTREYRPGDSPRTVHWRSSARTGRLIVKEFAREEEPALTVALDLFPAGEEGKHSPFETAIRVAASLAFYASQKGIPFHLAAASPRWQPPRAPLSWWAALNLLAKLRADGEEPFERLLARQAGVPLLVALVSAPSPEIFRALATLQRRGTRLLVVVITPEGTLPPEAQGLRAGGAELLAATPTTWVEALEARPPVTGRTGR